MKSSITIICNLIFPMSSSLSSSMSNQRSIPILLLWIAAHVHTNRPKTQIFFYKYNLKKKILMRPQYIIIQKLIQNVFLNDLIFLGFAQVFPTSEGIDATMALWSFSKLDQNLCFANLKDFPFLYESFVQLVSFHPSFYFTQLSLHLDALFCFDQEIQDNCIQVRTFLLHNDVDWYKIIYIKYQKALVSFLDFDLFPMFKKCSSREN